MSTLDCPYCGFEQDFTPESDGIFQGSHAHECQECEKGFSFTAEASIDYYPIEAECLNDGNHRWEVTMTYPRQYAKMECETCHMRRDPTEMEMQEILEQDKK